MQLSQQFYESYKSHTSISGAANAFATSSAALSYFQNLMAPTYTPGIMFNSIKAGVACDYPVIDKNLSFANQNVYLSGSDYYLGTGSVSRAKVFDRRIPFEAIIDPEDYLTDRIYCNEPHLYANNSGSVLWDGNGDKLYKLMTSNFLAETANFFLKNSNSTSISSKPSVDPNVGNAVSGTTYMMRIKMYMKPWKVVIFPPSRDLKVSILLLNIRTELMRILQCILAQVLSVPHQDQSPVSSSMDPIRDWVRTMHLLLLIIMDKHIATLHLRQRKQRNIQLVKL